MRVRSEEENGDVTLTWGEDDRYSMYCRFDERMEIEGARPIVMITIDDAWQSPGDPPSVPIDKETANAIIGELAFFATRKL